MQLRRRELLKGAAALASGVSLPAGAVRAATSAPSYPYLGRTEDYAGPFVEFTIEGDVNQGETIYSPSLEVQDGKVKIPDGPGWGVKINPAWLEKASYQKSEQQKRR